MTSTLRLARALLVSPGFHHWLHFATKMIQTDHNQRFSHPRRFREKVAQPSRLEWAEPLCSSFHLLSHASHPVGMVTKYS